MKKLVALTILFLFTEIVSSQTNKSINLCKKGDESYKQKDYNQAIKFYDKSIKNSPDYCKPYLWRGFSYYILQKYDMAMSDFNKVIDLEPNSPNQQVYHFRGLINEGVTKNKEAALKDYIKSIELDPKCSDSYYRISILKFESNDFVGAQQAIKKAVGIKENPIYLEMAEKIKIKLIKLGIPSEVNIGNQIWTASNLNVEKFRNGDPILQAKTEKEWFKAQENHQPAWCYYDNDPSNEVRVGKLYNWYAVKDSRGLAPEGWHIPSQQEWVQLMKYLGGDGGSQKMEIQYKEGTKVEDVKYIQPGGKEGTAGYNIFSCGFSPEKGGGRDIYGIFSDGHFRGGVGKWWSSSASNQDNKFKAFSITIDEYWKTMEGYYKECGEGYSVRCIKNQ